MEWGEKKEKKEETRRERSCTGLARDRGHVGIKAIKTVASGLGLFYVSGRKMATLEHLEKKHNKYVRGNRIGLEEQNLTRFVWVWIIIQKSRLGTESASKSCMCFLP